MKMKATATANDQVIKRRVSAKTPTATVQKACASRGEFIDPPKYEFYAKANIVIIIIIVSYYHHRLRRILQQ
jgi:hypothetical protein